MSKQGDRINRQHEYERSQQPKHTPTPWRIRDVHPDKWTRQVWTDESHGSVMIATTGGVDKNANAAFIVRACNAHEEMLAALEAILPKGCTRLRDDSSFVSQVRAAIAKAKGEK